MSSDLIPFDFHGAQVRVISDEHGDPWFILNDLVNVLGIQNVGNVLARLAGDQKGSIRLADGTPGNPNRATVNESGMWTVVLRSDSPAAEPVRRWVTGEVLPAIRRHGGYLTPAMAEQVLSDPDTIIRLATDLKVEREKRLEAEAVAARAASELEVVTPKARAWETFLSASGDMSVFDAAKALARADIVIGGQRLFRWLIEHRWCYRGSDTAPRAMQERIDAGHLRHKEQGHYHPGTGEWVIDPPQVRVTPKGLDLLAKRVVTTGKAVA